MIKISVPGLQSLDAGSVCHLFRFITYFLSLNVVQRSDSIVSFLRAWTRVCQFLKNPALTLSRLSASIFFGLQQLFYHRSNVGNSI